MTPQEKLKEIKDLTRKNDLKTGWLHDPNTNWLISRVEQLERALTKYSENTDIYWGEWYAHAMAALLTMP